MKRENFIVSCGDVTATKHKWNSALRAMPEVVKANLAPRDEAILIDKDLTKDGFYFTKGKFIWEVNNARRLVVYITKV